MKCRGKNFKNTNTLFRRRYIFLPVIIIIIIIKTETSTTSTILHINTNFLMLILSRRLPDKFFSCSFFSSLKFELRSTPLLSLLNVEVLPLSLSISSLLLSTMIKIKIRSLKKKKKNITAQFNLSLWNSNLDSKFDCFGLLLGDYSFWLAIFQIQLYPYIKIISFEFCHCFCSSVCNILTKRG